ncbi:MAG: ParA family protein, partial [Oscillospiraceae bacterium]|nr:ParA family protein [Oscillospiraceae bacterium]
MKKLAMFNNKGGVGKSTSAINVAHAMTRLGKKVLVVDCDTQQNTFFFFSGKKNEHYCSKTRYDNLKIALDIANGYDIDCDYAILDLPPALDERTRQIVSSCDYVFVPIELGKFAIQGVAKVTQTIATTGTKFGGCFVNKFDKDNPADHKLDVALRQTFGSQAL